jgi:hypothetical protein
MPLRRRPGKGSLSWPRLAATLQATRIIRLRLPASPSVASSERAHPRPSRLNAAHRPLPHPTPTPPTSFKFALPRFTPSQIRNRMQSSFPLNVSSRYPIPTSSQRWLHGCPAIAHPRPLPAAQTRHARTTRDLLRVVRTPVATLATKGLIISKIVNAICRYLQSFCGIGGRTLTVVRRVVVLY